MARQGLGDKQIARGLGLSPDTVRTYWQRIRNKIGASSRAEIIATLGLAQTAAAIKEVETEKDALKQEIRRRRSVEKALRASEQQWRNLADSIPHMVFVSQPFGEVVYLNRQVYEYTGLTECALIEDGWAAIVHPDDKPKILRGLKHLQAEGVFPEILGRFRRFDGEYRWHYNQVVAVKGDDGNIICWYGTGTDVHEQVLLQERLTQAQKLAKVAAFEFDISTNRGRLAAHFFERLEMSPIEDWFDADLVLRYLHPDDQHILATALDRTATTGEPFDLTYRMLLESGRIVWIRSIAKAVTLRDGTIRIEGTSQDITETQTYAEEIERREAALSSAEKVAKLGSYDWDLRTKVFTGSPNLICLFEQEDVETVRENFQKILHPDDLELYQKNMDSTLKTGARFDMKYRLLLKGGTRWIHAIGLPAVENGNVVRLVGTCQDITDEIAARSTFDRQRIQFQLAEQMAKLGSFSADYVSKDLVWSDYMYRLFDRSTKEGPMWSDEIEARVHPDDLPAYQRELGLVRTQGGTIDLEFRYQLRTGKYRWLHTKVIGALHNNVLVAAHGIVQDVTDAPFGFIGA